MQQVPVIRDEKPADIDAIREVTVAAFAPLKISNKTEHLIIEGLRLAGALAISLVAEREGRIVGHRGASCALAGHAVGRDARLVRSGTGLGPAGLRAPGNRYSTD